LFYKTSRINGSDCVKLVCSKPKTPIEGNNLGFWEMERILRDEYVKGGLL